MKDNELIDLMMSKILPERTVTLKGFNENGKEVTVQKITYKAGGFDIKHRYVNHEYK